MSLPESVKYHFQDLGIYASTLISFPIAHLAPVDLSDLRLDITSYVHFFQTPSDCLGVPSSDA